MKRTRNSWQSDGGVGSFESMPMLSCLIVQDRSSGCAFSVFKGSYKSWKIDVQRGGPLGL